ncbi:leucyl/phenylalanyl-tRNA--protein transferase [Porticoccus sp. W117]|uniref:leucyl/phenylalanyl-tRNA--protein transferase n=1 Tax=Porticoccus sp. W117 TaxID=3054777 RepID=UPI0025931FBF|nr:leucyl/phenylalanyl-tRNA--protein transferase [Porticoccus sp. W117]MDM3871946.1 leucyl/phenylalanyl-tRNA--protein transferase [Porticoccus sp. W117]
MTELTLLDSHQPVFPPPQSALTNPNGLLAVGGNLNPKTLLDAYRQGIFPWYSEGEPLLWWSPEPRAVIYPGDLHISKSLAKLYRQQRYEVSFNRDFAEVIGHCQNTPRVDGGGTWITDEMLNAYCELHRQGHAHSVEIWHKDRLVGGLYGIAVGSVFCGESMFSTVSNSSKLALLALCKQVGGLKLVDCQLPNPHLSSLGAVEIPRREFLAQLQKFGTEALSWPS